MSKEKWLLFNADNVILGRLASLISIKLMGKDRTDYVPNKVTGSQIIVINSKKIRVTGKKFKQKFYYSHSEYPGGFKIINFKNMLEKNPNFIIKSAVKGMLPKNKLQKILLKRLKIYQDDSHPHFAQKPKLIEFK